MHKMSFAPVADRIQDMPLLANVSIMQTERSGRRSLRGCMIQTQHEDLSRSISQVLESMQRKGQQIRQLREYCDMLPV